MSQVGQLPHREYPQELASVVVLEDGSLRRELIGVPDKDDDTEGRAEGLVLFQRGLLPAPRTPRCHRSILSTYKITEGDQVANVPWANFSWIKSNRASEMMRIAQCTDCSRDDCVKCFEKLTADDVMVVWIHDNKGNKMFQWYVAFQHKNKVLTRIPAHFCTGIVNSSSIIGYCRCGRCMHPLHDMLGRRRDVGGDNFNKRAVALFSELRKSVNAAKGKDAKQAPAEPSGAGAYVEDTCAICLEETFVSTDCCVQKRCSVRVCAACRKKTRGLCPICDRAKLSKSMVFMCHSCNQGVPLGEFGHECLRCEEPKVCKRCYKNFSVCIPCESYLIRKSSNKRNINVCA